MESDSHLPTADGAPATVAERMALDAARARMLGMSPGVRKLGRYEVGERIGKGGMAEVYRAFDPSLRRTVALKVVTGSRRRTAARIVREAQAQASLAHPNVVEVYDVGAVGADVFIAMELMQGPSLRTWVRQSKRTWREILDVFLEAGRGLVAAHAANLVHRDFKPGNVLMTRDGRVKVADFGLAIRSQDTSELSVSDETEPAYLIESRLTETGATVGTPLYMAPEQHQGHRLDAQADQYAFCVALLEALLGEAPFALKSFEHLAEQKRRRPKVNRGKVPRGVVAAALRGLEPHPSDRWPSMQALVDALERAASRRRFGTVVVIGTLAVGATAWMWLGARDADACADAQLEWNDEARERMQGAFVATNAPHAETTWAQVSSDLDAYAASWTATLSEVCDADPRPRFEDPRLACLRRQRRRFDALVDALADVRPEALDDAGMAESSLARPRGCLDPQVGAAATPPTGPDAEAIEAMLAEANALTRAFRFESAREIAMAALVRAQEARHRTLEADAELQLGIIASMADENDVALEHLERAYFLADELGAHSLAATAAGKLVFALSAVEATTEQVDRWNAYAQAHLEALEGSGPKATVLLSIGTMWLRRGEYDKAAEISIEAASTFEAEYGPMHSGVAGALSNAGYAYTEMGDVDRALELLTRSSNIYEKVLGPGHPGHGRVLLNRSLALYRSARFTQALQNLDRAIEVFSSQSKVPGGMIAKCQMNRGLALLELDRTDESLQALERARELYIESYGPTHSELSLVDMNIGLVHHTQSRFDEALVAYERALASQVERLGTEHPHTGLTEHNIGVTLNAAERYAEALPHLRSARQVFEAKMGPRSHLFAAASMELGHALDRSGSSTRGLAMIDDALSILEAQQPEHGRFVVMAMLYRADALGSLDRHQEAQRQLEEGVERAEQLSDSDPELFFDLHRQRATVARALGQHDEARRRLRAALDIAKSNPVAPDKVAGARQDLADLRR